MVAIAYASNHYRVSKTGSALLTSSRKRTVLNHVAKIKSIDRIN